MRRWTFTPGQGVPAPVAPYSHATAAGGLLCITGQLPINAAYEPWFGVDELPARTCVAVDGLAVGALVEIDLLVAHPDVGGRG